jgi:undecaprenyl-diphosphatase
MSPHAGADPSPTFDTLGSVAKAFHVRVTSFPSRLRSLRGVFAWFPTWVAHADFWLHAAVLAIVALLWGFVALSEEVLEEGKHGFDRRLLLFMRESGDLKDPIGPVWFESAWPQITALGSSVIVGLLTALVVGFLLVERKPRAAVLVLVAVIGGALLSTVLKLTFGRPRPDVVAHLVHVSSASFPSGHSLISAVIYPTLGAMLASLSVNRRTKIYYLACAFVLMLLVGISRMYLGVHYPSDVLGGWALGLAWSLACWVGSEMLQRRGALRGEHID